MVAKPQISREAIDRIRAAIDGKMLINRLQQFALGDVITISERGENGETVFRTMVEDADGTRRKAMTKEQIAAARVMLDKLLPTPQSIDVNQETTTTFVLRAPLPSKDMDEWLQQYGPRTIEGSTTPPSGLPNPAPRRPS